MISYYQQVGRAGRAIERADVVLLRGREDRRIQDFFIEQAFPPKERVDRVLEALEDDGATTNELMGAVNLGKSRIEAMLKVLDVEGAVAREGTRWVRVPGSDWHYDGDRYAHVTALRRREQEAMAAFGADGRCLMRALQEELDDPDPRRLRRLRGLHGAALRRPARPRAGPRGRAAPALAPAVLDVKKMAPDAEGKMQKLGDDVRAEEGRALARLGDGGWDPLVAGGPPRRPLRRRAGGGRRRGGADLARAGALGRGGAVAGAAARSCPTSRSGSRRRSGLPFHAVLERVGDNPPQREMTNSVQQVANVRGEFAVAGAAAGARACSSTTSASAAGRWRWSRASSAARAPARSTRSRSPPRSRPIWTVGFASGGDVRVGTRA